MGGHRQTRIIRGELALLTLLSLFRKPHWIRKKKKMKRKKGTKRKIKTILRHWPKKSGNPPLVSEGRQKGDRQVPHVGDLCFAPQVQPLNDMSKIKNKN
jgi:hypothetical protein